MEDSQRSGTWVLRPLGYLFLFLLVVRFAIDFPVHEGWIENPSLLPLLQGLVLVLHVLLVVLLLVIVWNWPKTGRYSRRNKILLTSVICLSLLGEIARRLGLSDWIERQGRPFDTAFYVLTVLLFTALTIAMCIIAVKDWQERTTHDIRAKLGTHEAGRSDSSPRHSLSEQGGWK